MLLCQTCCWSGCATCRRRANPGIDGSGMDGARAWVVAFAASGVYGLAASMITCTGIVYMETVQHLASSYHITLWAFNFGGLIALLSGPLVGCLIARTSHRSVMMLGTIFMVAGIVLTGRMASAEHVFISWGIYGFGLGCLLLTSITCTAQHFRRYHGLSVGVVSCGGGIMSLVVPPLLRWLLDEYSFDGGMLVLGGVMLHAMPLSLLVWPPSPDGAAILQRSHSSFISIAAACRSCGLIRASSPRLGSAGTAAISGTRDAASEWMPATDEVKLLSVTTITVARDTSAEQHSVAAECDVTSSALADAPVEIRDLGVATVAVVGQAAPPPAAGRAPACGAAAMAAAVATVYPSWRLLLLDRRTWVIAFTAFFLELGMSIIYTIAVPYGEAAGVDKAIVADLLAVCGAVQVPFVALHGWASDRKVASARTHVAACSLATGLAALLCPAVPDPAWGLGLLLVCVGAAGSAVFTLMPVAISESLGRPAMERATGVQMVAQSIGLVTSTLAAGAMYEATESWSIVMYYIGAVLMMASVVSGGYQLWSSHHRPRACCWFVDTSLEFSASK